MQAPYFARYNMCDSFELQICAVEYNILNKL